jgi:hypothetical protein
MRTGELYKKEQNLQAHLDPFQSIAVTSGWDGDYQEIKYDMSVVFISEAKVLYSQLSTMLFMTLGIVGSDYPTDVEIKVSEPENCCLQIISHWKLPKLDAICHAFSLHSYGSCLNSHIVPNVPPDPNQKHSS